MENRFRNAVRRSVLAVLVLGAAPAMAASPTEGGLPINDISGEWSGKGFVQKDDKSRKVGVNCKIEGRHTGDWIQFDGSCRAMLVMKRDIGAKLTKADGIYTGTYKGADVGIADLEGEQTGPDEIVLQMTFPRKVHGDDIAVMTINNDNEDEFTITTTDRMESGVEVITSQITFQRDKDVAQR